MRRSEPKRRIDISAQLMRKQVWIEADREESADQLC